MVRTKVLFRVSDARHHLQVREDLAHWLQPVLGCPDATTEVVDQLVTSGWCCETSSLSPIQLASVIVLLEDLFDAGGVIRSIQWDACEILVAHRCSPCYSRLQDISVASELVFAPSSAVVVRKADVILESGDPSLSIVLCEGDLVDYLLAFRTPCTVEQAQRWVPSALLDVVPDLVDFLVRQGFLINPKGGQLAAQHTLQWHEQLFYSKTRTKPSRLLAPTHLTRTSLSTTTDLEPLPDAFAVPLHELMYRRQSSARYDRMLTVGELMMLVRFAMLPWPVQHSTAEQARLPYPTCGGFRSLTVRCMVFDVENVQPGIHVIAGASLVQTSASSRVALRAVASELRQSLAQDNHWKPQALILLEAATDQVAAKYPGLALSLLLREAGACLEVIHLLGAAMELSVCAVGVVSDTLLDAADRRCPPNVVRLLEIAIGGGSRL